MQKTFSLFLFITLHFFGSAQVKEFDQLEMRYNQLHYKHVYRNAQKLLDNPQYDFSYLPQYYLALTQLQLAQDKRWRKKNKHAIADAEKILKHLQHTIDGKKLLQRHQYEMSALKKDLIHWMYLLKREQEQVLFSEIKQLITTIFHEIPDVETLNKDYIEITPNAKLETPIVEEKEKRKAPKTISIEAERHDVTTFAETLLGVPYKWAGESPDGFDCSGFTSYVMKNSIHLGISRTATQQYKQADHIKKKNVKPGDFVFFSNGSGISHVGIVYSTNYNSIQMIHASSSVGVSLVDIYQSSYWKKRIKGFGRYIEE